MIPVIFINCSNESFIDHILNGYKKYETRSRNTLKSLLEWSLGNRFLFAETGSGAPLVRFSAVIDHVITVYTREAWLKYADKTCVPADSEYDWKPGTTKKVLYSLTDIQRVNPFLLPSSCRRHGRVWAEYEEGSVSE